MELGPVEYVIIDFPGNRFTGEIAPALADLVDRGLVRIIDLVFVRKDADGVVTFLEYDELDELSDFASVDGETDGVLNDEDVAELAADLAPDSSALFVLWEDLWAAEFAQAVRNAGGRVVGGERIPREAVAELLEELTS